MLTVVLWPSSAALADQPIDSRPVWQRVFDCYPSPDRCVLISKTALRTQDSSSTASAVSQLQSPAALVRSVRRLEGCVILTRALICLQDRTVKKLIRATTRGPVRLSDADDDVLALAITADDLRGFHKALASASSWKSLVSRIDTRAITVSDPVEIIHIDSVRNLIEARRVLAQRKIERLIQRGVQFPDPANVQIADDVFVGRGTTIAPWVVLETGTRIGRDCSVGSFNHVVRSEIGDGTVVLDHCYIADSKIGKSAQIGPFSHLRPASDVGNEAKVGNFVELKNTKLGKKGKISHLAYVGDAVTGNGVNIGAGVITCNYDGKHKHQTVVGDGAFIGSDVQLVAPVRIGKGAYIAAGSCIVDDVPARALALARSRQVIKEGWAKKKR